MHRHDLDALRAVASHVELETVLESSPREVRVRGRLRGREVAVRFLVDPQREPKRLVRLEASLATHGPLRAPGLVPVLEAHPEADPPYLVEEPVAGEPLDRALARGAVPGLRRAAGDLAGALAALAERRLAHGAVAPEQVRVDADGGLHLGGLAGAPAAPDAFAPPEELAGRSAGAPGDVYALALILCELAGGCPLFGPEAASRVTPATRMGGWTPPPNIEARLDAWLAPVVAAALDSKPAQRPSAASVHAAATRRATIPVRGMPAPAVLVAAVLALLWFQSADRRVPGGGELKTRHRGDAIAGPARRAAPSPAVREDVAKLVREGRRLLIREEFRAASRVFGRALDLAPRDGAVWAGVGAASEGLGALSDAERGYSVALRCDPRDAYVLMRLAHLRDMQGRSAEAEKLLRQALEVWPGYSCGKVQLARVLRGRLDRSEADRLVNEQLARDPKAGHDAAHLGYLLWGLSRTAEAETYIRRGVEDASVNPTSVAELIRFLEEMQGDDEALGVASRLLAREPRRADVHAIVARIRARKGDVLGAAKSLEAAQELNPADARSLGEIGRTLIQMNGTPERARVLLERAVQMDPLYHAAWEDLAVVHLDAGDTSAARAAVTRALGARPSCARCADLAAINAGARTLRMEQHPPVRDAIRAYRLALALVGEEGGSRAEARRHIQIALAREPANRLFARLADRIDRIDHGW